MFNGDISLNYNGDPKPNWRVVTAACRHRDSGLVVVGVRHFDSLMRAQILAINGNDQKLCADADKWKELNWPKDWNGAEQGFVDNHGDFLTREEAFQLAKKAGQLKEVCYGTTIEVLFSEDIH